MIKRKIEKNKLVEVLKKAKQQGFEHLSCLSVVDWPEKKKFELNYLIWSYKKKKLLSIKTFIERDKPQIKSVVELWGANAEAHEREAHELFGIDFEGNKNLTPLFLKDWKGKPPFRKDFDWRKFVNKKYFGDKNA